MPSVVRVIRVGVPLFGAIVLFGTSPARAQMSMPGGGRSLGGYGASTIGSYYSSGTGGYIPYNGRASGFVPYAGGMGGGLGTQPIPRRPAQTPVGGAMMTGTPIGGASLSGGMGAGPRGRMGTGMDSRPGRSPLVPFGYEGGLGMGGMSSMPTTPQGGMPRPSGPGFGWPFRMPPSLGGPSMTMP